MVSDLELVLSVFEAGSLVELPAEGYSMFPAFCPGERFVVRPTGVDERLERGMVVVGLRKDAGHRAQGAGEDILVMHRLVEIIENEKGETLFITRGDSRPEADEPWADFEIIGVVTGKRTESGVESVRVFLPGALRRKVNRLVLWGYWKIRRVQCLKFKA